jgi:hypothetical protein
MTADPQVTQTSSGQSSCESAHGGCSNDRGPSHTVHNMTCSVRVDMVDHLSSPSPCHASLTVPDICAGVSPDGI